MRPERELVKSNSTETEPPIVIDEIVEQTINVKLQNRNCAEEHTHI